MTVLLEGTDKLALRWTQYRFALKDLVIPAYQRPVQHSLVKQIVTHFDPRKLQPLTVNIREDGAAYLIDGQQRRQALLQLGYGDYELSCITYMGLTEQEEAFIYTATQETGARRILLPMQQLRGAFFAGDPEAIEITQVVEQAGLTMDEHAPTQHDNLHAVATARRIYRRYGITHLADTLSVILRAYPPTPDMSVAKDPNRGRLNGQVLMGVASFLGRYPEADHDRLSDVMAQAGLEHLRQLTADYRKVTHTGRWEVAVGRALLSLYNQRLRSGALPAWEDRA